ncbi:hypothetical protein D3C78_1380540 [compost metagenome]
MRFSSGQLAWVRRLDRDGRITAVQLTSSAVINPQDAGALLSDGELAGLGRVEAVVVPGAE